jgi:hypothetical protein
MLVLPMVHKVKNYITPGGYRRVQEELARLWKVERPPVVATVTSVQATAIARLTRRWNGLQ